MRVERLLSDTIERLREAFGDDLSAVALFGSRARGDARTESDVDVFVVLRRAPTDPFERARRLSRAQSAQVDFALNLVARTEAEFESDIAPLDLDLALDARILFERGGYLSGRLAVVRQRIDEAGLVRGPDLSWRWRVTPRTCDWAITWEGVRT